MNYGSLGLLLLGIWLIASGALSVTGLYFPHAGTLLSLLAICSGALIIIGQRSGGWWR